MFLFFLVFFYIANFYICAIINISLLFTQILHIPPFLGFRLHVDMEYLVVITNAMTFEVETFNWSTKPRALVSELLFSYPKEQQKNYKTSGFVQNETYKKLN